MKLLLLGLGGPEILVIAILVLLLFGGKKIPELMSGIGKGVKSFRDGMSGATTIEEKEEKEEEKKGEKVEKEGKKEKKEGE